MSSSTESNFDKPLIIDFIAGSAAGVGMCLSGHPLDTIKVHIQSAPANAKIGIFSCTKNIIKTFGPMGLYRGVLSPLSSTPLINATVFAGESFCSRFIRRDLNPVISTFMSGFCAGAFQTVVLCPTDVIKLKMQLTNTKLNTVCMTRHILETSGIGSLFRGFWITLYRDAPAYGVYFSSFEYLTSKFLDLTVDPTRGYNLLVNFFSGGIAGILCWIVTYPLDIVKTRYQNITKYKDYNTVARELYKENGLKGFFRGLNSTIIRFKMNQNFNLPLDMNLFLLAYQQNNPTLTPLTTIFPNVMPNLTQQVQSYEFLQAWFQTCNNLNLSASTKEFPPINIPNTLNQSISNMMSPNQIENLPQAYQRFLTYDKIEINFPRTVNTPLMKKNEGVFHDSRKQQLNTPDSGIDSPSTSKNVAESPKKEDDDKNSSKSSDTILSNNLEQATPIKCYNGKKKNYCYVCDKYIVNRNGRNQGPRRHVLQVHMKKPLYMCGICNYSSTYDKYHVTSHIKRIHDIENTDEYIINNKYEQEPEVCIWYKKCFEERLDSR
uniref:Mitochondrial carrier domain-containing protein n=1 Tax=Parastrongyloides trichosuri TaxID=131310 RepID=A0A0N4Z0M0_PARTI